MECGQEPRKGHSMGHSINKRVTKEDVENMVMLYNDGMKMEEIAKTIHKSLSSVSYHLAKVSNVTKRSVSRKNIMHNSEKTIAETQKLMSAAEKYMQSLTKGQVIQVTRRKSEGNAPVTLQGQIIYSSNNYITVQCKNYKETIMYKDILNRLCKIELVQAI